MKLTLVLGIALVALTAREVLAAEPPRPNILFFYVDDMGWGSIGPNGQADRKAKGLPYVRTPNLDRLAAQGVNFTRGYGCTVCSPARSSLQTGFHQGHTFADRNDPNNAKKAIRADDVSIGRALSSVGYATGYWGKWGYGGSKDQSDPVIQNVQTLPTSHGFKNVLAELHHVRAHTFFQPTLWSAPAAPDAIGGIELIPNSMGRYQNNAAWPNTPALQDHPDYPRTAYCDDAYAFAALDFVRTQGQEYNQYGQPFFGLLAVQIPHAPFAEISTLPGWDEAYADDPQFASLADQTRQWAAMVTRIDAHFGNILDALEDPNSDGDTSDSIADNTLVIFQSDNGGPGGNNNVELNANGGLRGNKGKIDEGGIRVPWVMRWPLKITHDSAFKAGTNSDMVVDVSDLLPTFCELAGASAPLGIDGVSIAPTLMGTGQQRRREFIIHEAGNSQSIIRGNLKLVRTKNRSISLYDLETDHAEANNIADDHPEIVQELTSLLLGERVAEPRGFANTYHQWTGGDKSLATDAENWSDYEYANAGISYMKDAGAPQLSWVARMENTGDTSSTARAASDLEFLGLAIGGNAGKHVEQILVLEPNVNLTGRNEIRLGSHGRLQVNGGTVSSLRWVDINSGATLSGNGSVDAAVFNRGAVAVTGADQRTLQITGNYQQTGTGELRLSLTRDGAASLQVTGEAELGGVLTVALGKDFKTKAGASFVVLKAKRVEGTFANPGGEVVSSGGTQFTIGYTGSAVTLTAK